MEGIEEGSKVSSRALSPSARFAALWVSFRPAIDGHHGGGASETTDEFDPSVVPGTGVAPRSTSRLALAHRSETTRSPQLPPTHTHSSTRSL